MRLILTTLTIRTTEDMRKYVLHFQVTPPTPVYMKFYFFEVTNPREVEAGLERPRLMERGPYSYLQYRRKVNISKEWEGKDKIRYEDCNMSKIKGARSGPWIPKKFG